MKLPKLTRVEGANGVSRGHCRNMGLTIFLAGLLSLAAIDATAQYGVVSLAWQPSPSANVAGYEFYYGEASGDYTASMDVGTNLTATAAGLTIGMTYYFAVTTYDTNGQEGVFSEEITNTIVLSPSIAVQPLSQTALAGSPVTLAVSATGTGPLVFQWFNGGSPIAGATDSSLSWPQVEYCNTGTYSVSVSNAAALVFSSNATLTVLAFPLILAQPQSQTVIATTAAAFSSTVVGNAPLSIQWYCGTTAIPGATSSTLAWASAADTNAGSYEFIASNALGAVTSSVVTLTVLPTNTIATVAGAYNGLFFETNDDGTPYITEATSGFLGNCIVASNGAYSAKVYLDGASCALAGTFSIVGSASSVISLHCRESSNATIVLQLDLINGSGQITGAVFRTNAGCPGCGWTAPLLGYVATNALPLLNRVHLSISPGSSANAPTDYGAATGLIVNGVLSLAGTLGDSATFSQTVPISMGGNVPLFSRLYTNGGLLAGWVNLAASTPSGNLTWIRPSGVLQPAGFSQGFTTVVQVGGTTYSWTSLVTAQTLGGASNNFTGPVGFQFVCASNCTCCALGRWVMAGNTQPHVVALCASDGTILACATVVTAGATPGAYAYANLAAPYPMTAGTNYYIFSAELEGGDQFNSNGNITTTSVATNVNAAVAAGTLPDGISACNNQGGPGQSYGPVNLQYTIP